MRTTLTIDDDLAAALKEQARRADKPLKQVVTDTLRRSLSPVLAEADPDYEVRPHDSGFRPGVSSSWRQGDPPSNSSSMDRQADGIWELGPGSVMTE